MFKVSLATYSIRLRYGSSRKLETLACFGAKNTDLYDVLRAGLVSLKRKRTINASTRHVISTRNVLRDDDDRTISGRIESGVYGRGSRLRRVDDWKITHTKTAKEADMLPFYFLFSIPEMADEGTLILERAGNAGIRKALGAALQTFVEKNHPGYSISVHHLVRDDVVKAYLDGGDVSAIRFIKFGLPKDFSEMLANGHKEQDGSLELIARVGRGKHFLVEKQLWRFLAGKVGIRRFVELSEFPYDTVKLDVSKDGSPRTVDLNKLKMRGFYDISDEVERDAHGNPKFDSIDQEARKLLASIWRASIRRRGDE